MRRCGGGGGGGHDTLKAHADHTAQQPAGALRRQRHQRRTARPTTVRIRVGATSEQRAHDVVAPMPARILEQRDVVEPPNARAFVRRERVVQRQSAELSHPKLRLLPAIDRFEQLAALLLGESAPRSSAAADQELGLALLAVACVHAACPQAATASTTAYSTAAALPAAAAKTIARASHIHISGYKEKKEGKMHSQIM
jgi:hypothetical protein